MSILRLAQLHIVIPQTYRELAIVSNLIQSETQLAWRSNELSCLYLFANCVNLRPKRQRKYDRAHFAQSHL